jgi:pSer/pThr/pTyr-binding forkhead associated (FHA) protein
MLNDLQSTNGTKLNGTPVTTAALIDGDEVRLGEAVLVYHGPPTPAQGS